jgi:hypothetical protein
VADVRHINSSGSNIRRNENSDLPSFKSVKCTETLRQTSVSMDDRDTMPGPFKRLPESIDPTFCPSKYEDSPSFRPKQCHQQIRLFVGARMMQRLGHTVGRRRGRCHHYVNSAVQARLDQPGDIRRKRSGKE